MQLGLSGSLVPQKGTGGEGEGGGRERREGKRGRKERGRGEGGKERERGGEGEQRRGEREDRWEEKIMITFASCTHYLQSLHFAISKPKLSSYMVQDLNTVESLLKDTLEIRTPG